MLADAMMSEPRGTTFAGLSTAILQTIAYADVFDYPLTLGEIHRYLIRTQSSQAEIDQFLQESKVVARAAGYYSLPGREMLADLRRRRERTSSQLWPKAIHYGRMISRLPFVRMVAVTGALAVNNVEREDDIDFLVVTEPGRLWSSRALVLLTGRLAKTQGITLCPNYLISLNTLAFPDETLYVAHEIKQMVPLAGRRVYDEILRQNAWAARLLPNAHSAPALPLLASQTIPSVLARPGLEAWLRTPPFASLERWEMDRKIRRLRREQADSPESQFSADCCKGHAHRHQERILVALNERLDRLQIERFE